VSTPDLDFRLLFEESPDILLVLLPDSPRFTMVGATRSRLIATHTTLAEIVGVGLFEKFPDNPDDPAASGTANLRASLERVLATREPDTMAVQKYDIRGPDGSFVVKHWSPRNLPVLNPAGEVQYILHRVEDVTELVHASEVGEELRDRTRQMEREVIQRSRELAAANLGLREANAQLGELDKAKTAFFSNVSHEFRTPLTLMLGPLEGSLEDPHEPLGPGQKARLQLVHDNALRLLKLVNALLDFSRLEAGRLRGRFAPLDLSTYTAELAGMFQSAAMGAGLRLVIDCPRPMAPVWVDRDMWEKVVPNLVSNAFKFTLTGEIAVRMRDDVDHVTLEVADTGIGIPEVELPRIFERFHRVESAVGRTYEGTGIGLALVKELVELHGGRVTVSSTVGQGTTFRVEIPRGFAHLPPDAVSQEAAVPRAGQEAFAHMAEASHWKGADATPGKPPPPAAGTHRPRVLVVDDNPDLRGYIAGLLSSSYVVHTAGDGVEGLALVRAERPDLVVSDVMMPRLDGHGLVRELRADPHTASTPVILLSARAGEDSTVEGLAAGSDDYLAKPFSARELLARVRTHVELARLRREWTEELENANRELDAFSYSVSHDLRAPLRAIDGFRVALEEDCAASLDARGRDHLERIGRNVKRMTALVDDLLKLARISRTPLSTQPVDLSALAHEVAMDVAQHSERSVRLDIEPGLTAQADANLLRVLLTNLLGNAWKFTGRSPQPHIAIGRNADGAFYVRDNGAGFDMRFADKLFAPFQRLHSPADFEGTGIGLAIVARIVHRHGGKVWAEGAVDAGATVYFTLGR
jgi:signal transduction histidine kinase